MDFHELVVFLLWGQNTDCGYWSHVELQFSPPRKSNQLTQSLLPSLPCLPLQSLCDQVLTLMRIFPCRAWGLGKVLASLLRISPTSSLSAKISLRYWAIFFCCWMLQWFSMDRITGNLQRGWWKYQKQGLKLVPLTRKYQELCCASTAETFPVSDTTCAFITGTWAAGTQHQENWTGSRTWTGGWTESTRPQNSSWLKGIAIREFRS